MAFSSNTRAQVDTLFWFAAPEVSTSVGDNPIFVRVMTYSSASTVELSLPANVGFTPITINVPANSVDSINLTAFLASIESPAADVAANNGIKITATEPVSAFYELRAGASKEVFSLKGTKALGDNFYTPFQNFWDNGATAPASFSSIDIVATEDNTTVLITPRTAVVGHAQNMTYSVTLQEGETYSARDVNTSGASTLSGSIVSSNNPVAVTLFSGALNNGGCLSTMGDQITTEEHLGRNHIIHAGTGGADRVYIMATQNGTSLTIDNSTTTSTLINWGETYELSLSDVDNYIAASKPVYVWHATGYGCNLGGAQVPPVLCAGTYSTAFTRTSADSLGLFLYTRTGFESQFEINGNNTLIQPSDFTDVPGTSGAFKMALIYFNTTDVPVNSYNEVTNNGDIFGLGVSNGNGNAGSGYAYFSEFGSYPFVTAGNDSTICANTTLDLNGVIGGGDITGTWSTSGFGTFSQPTNTVINEYVPSPLDTLISPIELILTSTGNCPVQRDTITLTVTPSPIVNANADQSVCDNNSIVDLDGAVSGGATTGIWTSLGTGSFALDTDLATTYTPSATDITSGSVQLVLTSTNPGTCQNETDTMLVTFTGSAVVDAGADTIFVCENSANASLNGSVTGITTTGKWTTSGGGLFTPNNITLNATYQPSVNDINNGSVWLYLESTGNGDCNIVFDSLIVVFTPSPTVDAGLNQTVCTNDPAIDLSGVISGATTTGVWTGGNGTYSTSDTDLNATYTPTAAEISSGNVFLTLTSTNNGGCVSVNDVVQFSFIAPPFANFNFTEECLNQGSVYTDFSLPGFGNITNWQWDFGDSNTGSNQNETHTYASPGSYTVQLIVTSDSGCSDTTTNTVAAYEMPVADFTYTSSCPNNQIIVDFTDNSTTISDPLTYWFYDFGGAGSIASENATQLFTADGTYTITHIVGTSNGCFDTTTQTLVVPAYPVAGFSYNSSNGLNIGAIFEFINTAQNASSYLWDLGNNVSSTDIDPNNTYFDNGTYVVTQYAFGDLGCVDSTSQTIVINTVTTEISTLIPNAISPNGDGKNDVWKLEFIDILYPNAQVEIYNEWGQMIFESTGYDIPWDGRFNDELVPDGTYYYVINLNSTGNPENDLFKGALLVLKSKG